jgi:hypothetical protein
MAIKPIKNYFAAYITLSGKRFFVTINRNLCNFFVCEDCDDLRVFFEGPVEEQIIYGFDEDKNNIAFPISLNVPSIPEFFLAFGYPLYQSFKTSYIIKGNRSSDELDKLGVFDAINFVGGVLDSIYPPGFQAVNTDIFRRPTEDGARTIEVYPYDKYTHSYPFELYGDTGEILYSFNSDGVDLMSGQLGKLSAMIRLEFDAPKPLVAFKRYYALMKKFISFCAGQHNINFAKVELKRKITEGKNAGKFQDLGICKVFDEYNDYVDSNCYSVLPIQLFGAHIINALSIFADEKVAPKLDFMPDSNIGKGYINCEDIKNLCTALEYEYAKGDFPTKNDEGIKNLKKTLKNVTCEYCSENSLSDAAKESVFSSIGRLGISAADKIYAICERLKAYWVNDEDVVDEKDIRAFVKTRNNITHGNPVTSLDDIAKTYVRLRRILYFCIVKRMGLPEEDLMHCLKAIKRMYS